MVDELDILRQAVERVYGVGESTGVSVAASLRQVAMIQVEVGMCTLEAAFSRAVFWAWLTRMSIFFRFASGSFGLATYSAPWYVCVWSVYQRVFEVARKITTEQFVARAREVHGDRYDYSLVKYTKAHDPVTIICSEHGEFVQKAYSHLNGRGCPTCGRKIVEQSRSPLQAEFLSRVLEKYGNRFGMAKAVYQSSHGPITVSCPVHGEFTTTPNRFLHPKNKYGCGQCGNEASGAFHAEDKLKTTEQFIEEAKAVHGDWYDYSKVEYVGAFCNVTIGCPVHGEFRQEDRVHLMGSGCTPCVLLSKSKSMSLPKEELTDSGL